MHGSRQTTSPTTEIKRLWLFLTPVIVSLSIATTVIVGPTAFAKDNKGEDFGPGCADDL